MPNTAIKIFYSYSRQNRDMLDKHLAPLRSARKIETWHDLQLEPGVAWEQDLLFRLQAADIILLLISADFMASEYCYSKELEIVIARHQAGKARVIPIILRDCDWNHADVPFSVLNVLLPQAQPIAHGAEAEIDRDFRIVAKQIREVVEYLQSDNLPPKTSVYFASIELTNILCFKNPQTLDLRSPQGTPAQWTVILGDNGVGKTTLLRSLAALEPTTSNIYTAKLSQDRTSIFAQSLHSSPNANINAKLTCGTLTNPESQAKSITLSLQPSQELIANSVTGNGKRALLNLQ